MILRNLKKNQAIRNSKKKNLNSFTDLNSAFEPKNNIDSFGDKKRNSIQNNFFNESDNKSILNQMTSAASGLNKSLNPHLFKIIENKSFQIEIKNKEFVEILEKKRNVTRDKKEKVIKMDLNEFEKNEDCFNKYFSARDKIIGNVRKKKDNLSIEKKKIYDHMSNLDDIWEANKILVKSKSLNGIDNISLNKKFEKNINISSDKASLIVNDNSDKNTNINKEEKKTLKKLILKLDDLHHFATLDELINNKDNSNEKCDTIIDNSQETVIKCKNLKKNYQDDNYENLKVSIPSMKKNNFYKNYFYSPNLSSKLNLLDEKTNIEIKNNKLAVFNFSKSELNKQILRLWKCNSNSQFNIKIKTKRDENQNITKIHPEINTIPADFGRIKNYNNIEISNEKEIQKNYSKINKSNILKNLEKKNLLNITALILRKIKLAREQRVKNSIIIKDKNSEIKDIQNKNNDIILNAANKSSNLIKGNVNNPIFDYDSITLEKADDKTYLVNDESIKNIFNEVKAHAFDFGSSILNKNVENSQIKSNLHSKNYSSKMNSIQHFYKNKVNLKKPFPYLKNNLVNDKNLRIHHSKTTSEGFYSNRKSNISLEKKNYNIKDNVSNNNDDLVMSTNKNKSKELKIIKIEKKAKSKLNINNNFQNPRMKAENKKEKNKIICSISPDVTKSRLSQKGFKKAFEKNNEGNFFCYISYFCL